jgi:hypothetical protein
MGITSPLRAVGELGLMREKSATESYSAAGVTSNVPWHVVEVRAVSDHSLAVRFIDGTQGEVDMIEILRSESPGVFVVLRDPAFFRQVYVEDGAVTWPGELDLAPDAMYYDIRKTGRRIAFSDRNPTSG